ncbi:MAG: hypothetical protein WDM78_00615 [Puia sp.]
MYPEHDQFKILSQRFNQGGFIHPGERFDILRIHCFLRKLKSKKLNPISFVNTILVLLSGIYLINNNPLMYFPITSTEILYSSRRKNWFKFFRYNFFRWTSFQVPVLIAGNIQNEQTKEY